MDEQQRISVVASSSNSSSMESSKKYDVFLSFRGEDTRRNFTSHLYKALNKARVETYIDNMLEKGDEISPALLKAIEDSYISVVIFSENYASSKWCLDELTKILECKNNQGQIVIPVFYNIDPSHVRKQTGSYEQAFAKHEGEPKCNKWKAALTEVANIAGLDSQTYRNDPELLKDIVEDILQKLPPKYRNQRKGLVGIEEHCKQIESLLKLESSEIITLGIWGMGGIGKTTIATALYDKLSYEFDGRCFLPTVREKSNKCLCDELFSKLSKNKSHSFDYSDMGRLQGKKFFIVLDDVATLDQLEKLIGEHDFLGPGSRVIVITRNKQILSPNDEIYEVEELSSYHSLQLFCLTVFGEKQPKDGYEDLSRRVISYCKGIPLALKVLGASLRKRSKEAWECELRKLKQIPKMEIHNVLKLSFDGLDHSEKDIFLDIACFFKGCPIYLLTSLLEACNFFAASGIEVLMDKALITITYGILIEMHDLIQEMGQQIVHQESIKDPGRRSRLWKHDEVFDVLKYNKGTDVVEGILLDFDNLTGSLCLSSDSFANMTNLRFLCIEEGYKTRFNVHLPNGLESLSDKLRFLSWDGCCLESLPTNFCAEQLVMLIMPNSKLKKLWDGVQNLVNLMYINLEDSQDLIEIPDLSKAEKLEIVLLGKCKSIRQLHPSKLSFPILKFLDLSYCRKIESLNVHSKSLCNVYLNGCSSLKETSVTSEELKKLDLSGCREIETLNVHSKSLHEVYLNTCSSLKEFSVTSEEMTWLNFSGTAICELPSSIGLLLCLEWLDLSRTNVESLSTNIKNLSMLGGLYLDDCRKLVSLPELPPSLRWLHLTNCWNLVSLPELPPLTELYLNNCRKLISLPELPSSLEKLRAMNCSSLDIEVTQRLVLKHMLQSHIPYLHQQFLNDPHCYDDGNFIIPRDHVTEERGFRTAKSAINIPYLPKSHLWGFIYCIILSRGPSKYASASYSICQDAVQVGCGSRFIGGKNLISDQVLFVYHDVRNFDRRSEVYDHFSNLSFIFEYQYYDRNKVVHDQERIKGCAVFPIYSTESGL